MEPVPIFGRLDDVLHVEGSIIFVCKQLKTDSFDSQFGAFQMKDIAGNAFRCFFCCLCQVPLFVQSCENIQWNVHQVKI